MIVLVSTSTRYADQLASGRPRSWHGTNRARFPHSRPARGAGGGPRAATPVHQRYARLTARHAAWAARRGHPRPCGRFDMPGPTRGARELHRLASRAD
eukprot:5525744-Prymnesium_polylepis.1